MSFLYTSYAALRVQVGAVVLYQAGREVAACVVDYFREDNCVDGELLVGQKLAVGLRDVLGLLVRLRLPEPV